MGLELLVSHFQRQDVLFSFAVVLAVRFIDDINHLLGQNVLLNFITGHYHRPRLEQRVFLFIDIEGSTTLAERLGDLAFHRLVDRFVSDLSGAEVPRPVAALTKALIASLGPPAAEGLGNAKHDELGEGYALDEQEGAVSAEDAERAFGLACPVRGQDTRGRLNQPKIFVGSSGQDRGVPEPEDDDQNEGAYERGGFECAASDPPRNG
jgi:hypothetical protein